MKFVYFALLVCSATIVPTAIGSGGDECNAVTIDFAKRPDDTPLQRGDYLSDEWYNEYGVTLSAAGGLGTKPRIFDTSEPGTNKYGDRDLGSPNERCTNSGPGRGEGGEPGEPGENCVPQGLALIIQEDNDHPEIPDDNVNGGTITFKFNRPVQVSKIGLLDIDYKSFIRISKSKQGTEDIPIPILGDNSAQTVTINKQGVNQLDLNLRRSGAITFLSFCYLKGGGRYEKLGLDEPCLDHSECESNHCWAEGSIEPDQPGLCKCDYDTNEGCPEGEDCRVPLPPGSAPACFVPVGASCSDDADCFSGSCFEDKCAACSTLTDYPCDRLTNRERCVYDYENGYICKAPGDGSIGSDCFEGVDCDTDYCFVGPFPPLGVCSCNTITNSGCEGDFECFGPSDFVEAFDILSFDSPPMCKLPIGAPCDPQKSGDCMTSVCNEKTRVCGCRAENHYPCITDDGERCVEDYDNGYICMAPGDGSIGSDCFEDDNCDTDLCFFGIGEPPGTCECNIFTNAGCKGSFVCDFLDDARGTYDAPPDCFLPIGAACDPENSDDCLTANCDEVTNLCTCSTYTDYPCDVDNGEVCLLQTIGYVCRVPFPIGSDCALDSECETDACHIFTPGFSGTCSCNTKTNKGCDEGLKCYSSDAIAEVQGRSKALPNCYLPFGDACVDDDSCLSLNCDDLTEKCTCNTETDHPCVGLEQCVLRADGIYACIEIGDGSLGSDCVEDSDCDTNMCHFKLFPPGHSGTCSCNTNTHEGCDEGLKCYSSDAIAEVQGINDQTPECYLPFDSACVDDDSCLSQNCDDVTERCTCSTETDHPCIGLERCLIGARGVYGCIEIGDGSFESACAENSDCDTDMCYFGYIQPGSPGDCHCNPSTDAGCDGEYECASESEIFEARRAIHIPHTCYLPFGAICDHTKPDTCLTGNCDEGVCTCNVDTHYPCVSNERCLRDLTGRFVCIEIGDGSLGGTCESNDDCDSGHCLISQPGYPGTCACNEVTSYPCDTASGEACILTDGSYVCRVLGDGEIGDECTDDSDCVTDFCFKVNPTEPGTCTCNTRPGNDEGCPGDLTCSDLFETQGLVGNPPDCFLHVADLCDEDIVDFTDCVTGNCDPWTGLCTCNEFTSYPCDTASGEECLVGAGGVYACIKIGDGSIGSTCTENSDCDTHHCLIGPFSAGSPGVCTCNPSNDAGCEGDFECADPHEIEDARGIGDHFYYHCHLPVGATCNYQKANECITGFCDLQESRCGCSLDTNYPCDIDAGQICLYNDGRYNCGFGPDPCPEPDPTVICPAVALRVNCLGCEYLNQCQATSAAHYFNLATCYRI